MKSLLKNQKSRLYCKRIIATACFLAIIAYVYASATYLFRGSSLNDYNDDRLNIIGIKEEEPLDMIYIGGSAAFCYWFPLQAWNDYGFTSYNLGSTSIQPENILYLMKYALKYQKPDLFVIGVRSFTDYSNEGYEAGLRYTSDAMDLGINRLRLIKTYYDRRVMEEDICSIYIDIAKHHSRYELLASPKAWSLADNAGEPLYKGVKLMDSYYYLDQPPYTDKERSREMERGATETLYELLDYCKEKNVNVLFVVSPYITRQDECELFVTMEDIITSNGFPFMNANDHFEEINLDLSEDFSDRGHVNVLGAEKYTDFLGKYIVENYGLTDHRVEGNASWDAAYADFADAIKKAKASVNDMIAAARHGEEIAEQLHDTEDLAVWCDLVNDSRLTVLAVGSGDLLNKISGQEKECLAEIGLTHTDDNNLMRILCNSKILYTNKDTGLSKCAMSIGAQKNVDCSIDNETLSIVINGEEYSRKDENGINIVVFQNDYRKVADTLTICRDEDGSVRLVR